MYRWGFLIFFSNSNSKGSLLVWTIQVRRGIIKKKNTSKMEVEARGTHVRLVNKWRNLLSHFSAVWTHPLEFKLVPGLGVGTLYKSTDLTSDTTPYFHNFIHMHGDTDSLFFPSPFELPTTHILCISSHAPTLSSPLQYSQSHILHLIPVLPTLSKFQILSHSLCV